MKSTILVGLAMFLSDTTRARADIPPPSDYVESCTVAKQQTGGTECVACNAWHGERDKCEKSVGTKGYEHVCKSWGASAWDEVWCKTGAAKPEVVPSTPVAPDAGTTDKPAEQPMPKTADVPAPKKSNCAGGGAETALGVAAALWLLARKRCA